VSLHVTITANRRDVAALKRKLEPKQYAKIIFGVAHEAAQIGAEEVRSEHWDIGATTRATVAENMSYGARVVTRSPGARPVEFGRRAGAKMPPPDVLREWASRHGMGGLEIPLARAIARRGIKGRFFMRRTKERLHTVVIPALMRKALAEIHVIWRSK